MIKILAIILPILSIIPALFPRWRDTLISSGIYWAIVVAAYIWAHFELNKMNSGEGPAFFTMMAYFGVIQIFFCGSYIAKLIAILIARKLSKPARTMVLKYIVMISLVTLVLALITNGIGLNEFVYLPLVFISVLCLPFLWVSFACWLLPDNV